MRWEQRGNLAYEPEILTVDGRAGGAIGVEVKKLNPNRFMGACVDITVPRNTSLLRLKLDKFFEDQTSGLEIRDEAKVLSHNNRVDFETAIISRRNLNWPWRGNLESQFNWKIKFNAQMLRQKSRRKNQ